MPSEWAQVVSVSSLDNRTSADGVDGGELGCVGVEPGCSLGVPAALAPAGSDPQAIAATHAATSSGERPVLPCISHTSHDGGRATYSDPLSPVRACPSCVRRSAGEPRCRYVMDDSTARQRPVKRGCVSLAGCRVDHLDHKLLFAAHRQLETSGERS